MSLYTAYFGLDHAPFSIAPDPRYLFLTERHREALAHLVYGLEGGGGFVLLTGDIGTGKTTVCRSFLEQIPPQCNVAYIFNPRLTVRELLQSVCEELGIAAPAPPAEGDPAGSKSWVDALNRYLLSQHAQGRNTVLIIDEAQNLSPDVLEQLRLLTNLETAERKLLQIVLIGQPELRDMLARPELEQLAQRVTARYHLGPLNAEETRAYVAHRLAVAGLNRPMPFDAGALREIHRQSAGVPRRINLLCDRALLGAFAKGSALADAATVRQAAREVMGEGAVPSSVVRRRWAWAGLGVAALGAAAALGWWGGRSGPTAPAVAWPRPTAASVGSTASAAAAPAPVVGPSSASTRLVASGGAPPASRVASVGTNASTQAAADGAWGQALVDLGQVHGLALSGVQACAGAVAPGWRCWRRKIDADLFQRLGRPLVVFLREPRGGVHYAQVARWDAEALVKQGQGSVQRVSPQQWHGQWTGDVMGLWAVPPGWQADPAVDRLPEATRQWLQQRLDAASGDPGGAALPLPERLRRFQRAHGMAPDGRLRPVTVMLLDRKAG